MVHSTVFYYMGILENQLTTFFLDVGKKHDNDELQGKNMTCQEYDQKNDIVMF